MKKWSLIGLCFPLLIWLLGDATGERQAGQPSQGEEHVASDDVPDAVAQEARRFAETQVSLQDTLKQSRIVYIGIERIREKTKKGEDDPREIYRVIHYRYDDDTALHSVLTLKDAVLLDYQEFPHLSTPLAKEELDAARTLALNDDDVRAKLGKYYADLVTVEALVIRTASEADPWFGRRIVQLLFRVDRDYLRSPRVIVDLTKSVVLIEP